MADKKQSSKTVFKRLSPDVAGGFQHLKPLSMYSRNIICDTNSCPSNPSGSSSIPFSNLKIKLVNRVSSVNGKRRLDDSCLDETYETPPKKLCRPKSDSPDLACVLDSSSTLPEIKPENKKSLSVKKDKLNKVGNGGTTKNSNSETQVAPVAKSASLAWSHSSDEDEGQGSLSLREDRLKIPPILFREDTVDGRPGFDFDVDEIMCLSPIDRDESNSNAFDDLVKISPNFCEEQSSELIRVHGSYLKSQRSEQLQGPAEGLLKKEKEDRESCCNDGDEGYFTKSYIRAASKQSIESTPPKSLPIMSTPLAAFKRQSFAVKSTLSLRNESRALDFMPVLASSAISLRGSVNMDACNNETPPKIPLLNNNGSALGEVPKVGTSKLTEFRDVLDTTAVSQVKEEDEEDVLVSQQQVDPKFQVTFDEDTDASTSFDTSLPLQVQVKSKVVVPNSQRLEPYTKPEGTTKPPQQSKRKLSGGQSKSHPSRNMRDCYHPYMPTLYRPVVFHSDEDWQREKKKYVNSVTSHMNDNAGTGDGVMTELLHLMNTVANQGKDRDGRNWHHPSDLTRRNYQLNSDGRLLSLDEWQDLNYRNHRRFATVPQVFIRSPVL